MQVVPLPATSTVQFKERSSLDATCWITTGESRGRLRVSMRRKLVTPSTRIWRASGKADDSAHDSAPAKKSLDRHLRHEVRVGDEHVWAPLELCLDPDRGRYTTAIAALRIRLALSMLIGHF
jgi:hypothetical protein